MRISHPFTNDADLFLHKGYYGNGSLSLHFKSVIITFYISGGARSMGADYKHQHTSNVSQTFCHFFASFCGIYYWAPEITIYNSKNGVLS